MILNPHASVVFCDDLRQEANGKQLHIGVYNDVVLFDGPLPWALPTGLWCLIKYLEPYPETLPTLAIKVRLESKAGGVVDLIEAPVPKTDIIPQRGPLEFEKDAVKLLALRMNIQLSTLVFQEPAKLVVVVVRDGEEISAGRLRISQLSRDGTGNPIPAAL
ncbi:hypothetical protein [Mesorhizobium sp. M0678]|uniref:hypothetical protein n=1 Tax=Mesorhizobium sp. M0678 TaxID=2956985 RepID=UPI0033368A08